MKKLITSGILAGAVGAVILSAAPAQATTGGWQDKDFWRNDGGDSGLLNVQLCRKTNVILTDILTNNDDKGDCINGPATRNDTAVSKRHTIVHVNRH